MNLSIAHFFPRGHRLSSNAGGGYKGSEWLLVPSRIITVARDILLCLWEMALASHGYSVFDEGS